jgi:hypothetical protein
VQYFVYVGVGTPAQELSVILDTGSTLLWVPVLGCECHPSHKFNPKASRSFHSYNLSDDIEYGQGYCRGVLGSETVRLGPQAAPNLTMLFVTQDRDMQGLRTAGIMGLSNDPSYPNIFEVLFEQGLISSPLFALELSRADSSSVLYFGDIPESILSSAQYAPASRRNYWSVRMTNLQAGGQLLLTRFEALVDSGTSFIVFPTAVLPGLLAQLPGCEYEDEIIYCPCLGDYPVLKFNAEHLLFELEPKQYLLVERGICYAGFSFMDFGMVILGDVFMRKYPVLFDKAHNRLGFWTPETAAVVGAQWVWWLMANLAAMVACIFLGMQVMSTLIKALESRQAHPVFELNTALLN